MKKNIICFIIVCLFVSVCIGAVVIVIFQKEGKIEDISGKILLDDPLAYSADRFQGLALLDPTTGTVTPLNINSTCAKFMKNSSGVIVEGSKRIEMVDWETGKIDVVYTSTVEVIDLKTGKTDVVYTSTSDWVFPIKFIAYVDEEYISVVDESTLYLVNILDGTKRVFDISSDHSWTGDGKKLYYSKAKIYEFNIETEETRELFDGSYPQISKDGSKLAYYESGTDVLIVKDLKSGEEWKHNNLVKKFCFSPDGKYVATIEYWRGIGVYLGDTVKIWDYENDVVQIVIPKYAGESFYIDWAE